MSRVIALTGATGFIGTALIDRLQSAGYQVHALYRENSAAKRVHAQTVRWVPGWLEDPGSLKRLLSGTDTIIHCAGTVRGADWRHFKKTNTDGVARMVQAVMQMHPPPRFLLLSSLAAREPTLSYYAASKRQGEEILKSADRCFHWDILRPPAVYGPGDREIAPLLQLMCKGLGLQATPSISRFSMVYIDDLVNAIVALIDRETWKESIFDLHDGRAGGYAWREVIQAVSKVAERPVYRVRVPQLVLRSAAVVNLGLSRLFGRAPMLSPGKVRELSHHDWTCNNAAITAATEWQPQTTLEDGIKKTLVYLGLIADKPYVQTRGTRHADV